MPRVTAVEWFVNDISIEELDSFDYEIYDEANGTEIVSELNIINIKLPRKDNEIQCIARTPSGLQSEAYVTVREDKNGSGLSMFLLPIVAGVSGFLIVILIISLAICFCKRGPKNNENEEENGYEVDEFDDIYDQGDENDNTHAQDNPYQDGINNGFYDHGYHDIDIPTPATDDGYVISQISGGIPRQPPRMSQRSDHPYATMQR